MSYYMYLECPSQLKKVGRNLYKFPNNQGFTYEHPCGFFMTLQNDWEISSDINRVILPMLASGQLLISLLTKYSLLLAEYGQYLMVRIRVTSRN